MINKETIEKLKSVLEDAKFAAGGEIFMDGEGRFVNRRCEYMASADVLVKVEKLRQAVNRAHDYASTLEAV